MFEKFPGFGDRVERLPILVVYPHRFCQCRVLLHYFSVSLLILGQIRIHDQFVELVEALAELFKLVYHSYLSGA